MSKYLEEVKSVIGISSNVRDEILTRIIDGVIGELTNSRITPDNQVDSYVKEYDSYVIDYAAWLYENRGGNKALDRHLQFRRHNLQLQHNDV